MFMYDDELFNTRCGQLRDIFRKPEFKVLEDILNEWILAKRIDLEIKKFNRLDEVADLQAQIGTLRSILNLFDEANENLKKLQEQAKT